jgi:hypothetical protein
MLQLLRSLPTQREWVPLPAVDVEEDEEAKTCSPMARDAAMETWKGPQSHRLKSWSTRNQHAGLKRCRHLHRLRPTLHCRPQHSCC